MVLSHSLFLYLSLNYIHSLDEYKNACSYYSDWMLTALCGICIVAYQSLLEFLATCGCIQGKKSFQNNCCGSRIKGCVEWFGGCMLTFCTSKILLTSNPMLELTRYC